MARSLPALFGDGGERRTDGLILFGERTEAVALGVQLLLDEAQHLARDPGREQVRADVGRADVESDLAGGAGDTAEPGRDAIAIAAELERQIALLVVVLALLLAIAASAALTD